MRLITHYMGSSMDWCNVNMVFVNNIMTANKIIDNKSTMAISVQCCLLGLASEHTPSWINVKRPYAAYLNRRDVA